MSSRMFLTEAKLKRIEYLVYVSRKLYNRLSSNVSKISRKKLTELRLAYNWKDYHKNPSCEEGLLCQFSNSLEIYHFQKID